MEVDSATPEQDSTMAETENEGTEDTLKDGSATSCIDSSQENITDTSDDKDDNEAEKQEEKLAQPDIQFKKPTLFGPKRVLQKTASHSMPQPAQSTEAASKAQSTITEEIDTQGSHGSTPSKDVPLPYVEPPWGGKPEQEYKLEVLKSGVILETIDLTDKSFHVVGRLPACNVSLAHPTISRYHAILQYRLQGDEKNPKGLYVYDLGSTHGTFWNGNRIRPNTYVRLHGGHMIRFGCSQRKYILLAPPEDQEEESELTVTELKEKRIQELQQRERAEKERQLQEEEAKRLQKEEEEKNGVNWGMGEDADEETDLTENPYASGTNEELYLEDPKKTLRGWFEREGYDLHYQTEERGIGQFLCWVDIPIESSASGTVKAEALVRGKKKEAVVQCALEACKILDRYGLLRQATHESRKRKAKNWEEQDYYDSDEDNYLDRTGSVEKKREQRMRMAGKFEDKPETYDSLLEKHQEVMKRISQLESRIQSSQQSSDADKTKDDNEDALDAFMSTLNASALSKSDVTKMKLELQNLRKEEAKLVHLVNLTKPTDLPPLISHASPESKEKPEKSHGNIIGNIGQRKRQRTSSTGNIDLSKLNAPPVSFDSKDTTNEEFDSDDESDGDQKSDQEKEDSKERMSEKSDEETEQEGTVNDEDEETAQEKMENGEKSPDKKQTVCKDENKAQKEGSKQQKRWKKKEAKSTYDEDLYREDYSMWTPPQNQSGDGKTSLNEKYGY